MVRTILSWTKWNQTVDNSGNEWSKSRGGTLGVVGLKRLLVAPRLGGRDNEGIVLGIALHPRKCPISEIIGLVLHLN